MISYVKAETREDGVIGVCDKAGRSLPSSKYIRCTQDEKSLPSAAFFHSPFPASS